MSKKKSVASNGKKSASRGRKVTAKANGQAATAVKKAPAKTAAAASRATKKPVAKKAAPARSTAATAVVDRKPVLSDTQIGETAGAIWGALADDGEKSLAAIKKAVDAPADLVLAAIGWLAREGKIEFATSGRSVKLSLR